MCPCWRFGEWVVYDGVIWYGPGSDVCAFAHLTDILYEHAGGFDTCLGMYLMPAYCHYILLRHLGSLAMIQHVHTVWNLIRAKRPCHICTPYIRVLNLKVHASQAIISPRRSFLW